MGATEPREWFAIWEYAYPGPTGAGYSFFGWIFAPGSHAKALTLFFQQSVLCNPQRTFVVLDQDGAVV